tara:strand:+ start:1155 stop:1454 length:300 start_codon:yes stop_codon:yes gene_type:complete
MVVFPSYNLPPFHGGNTGSNPVRDATSQIQAYIQKRCPSDFRLGGIFALCVTNVSQKSAYFLKIMKINRYGGAFFSFLVLKLTVYDIILTVDVKLRSKK